MNRINGFVYADGRGAGQTGIESQKKQKPQPERLTFRSFFISVFGRLQKETRDQTNQKSDAEGYAGPHRHLDKEIARQTDGKNSFSDIPNVFGEVFTSGVINNSHRDKAYHIENALSTRIIGNLGIGSTATTINHYGRGHGQRYAIERGVRWICIE